MTQYNRNVKDDIMRTCNQHGSLEVYHDHVINILEYFIYDLFWITH